APEMTACAVVPVVEALSFRGCVGVAFVRILDGKGSRFGAGLELSNRDRVGPRGHWRVLVQPALRLLAGSDGKRGSNREEKRGSAGWSSAAVRGARTHRAFPPAR